MSEICELNHISPMGSFNPWPPLKRVW